MTDAAQSNSEGPRGIEIGRGRLYNPREERINGLYRFVGLMDEDGKWVDIMPHKDGLGWLSELGPGRLVFIPDSGTAES